MCERVYARVFAHVCVCMYVCTRSNVCVPVCVLECMFVYVCVHVYMCTRSTVSTDTTTYRLSRTFADGPIAPLRKR